MPTARAFDAPGLIRTAVLLALFAVGCGLMPVRPAQAAGRNILLIIADDLGLEATTLYPSPPRIQTNPPPVPVPHLKALARDGVLFTNSWATPACSPTRATIFTGRYGFRTGVGTALPLVPDPAVPVLPESEIGLPRMFAGSSYLLAHIGKWHLTHGTNDPNRYGWPHFAGPDPSQTGGAIPNYYNWPKTVNGVSHTSTAYNTTDLVDDAVARIRAARAADQPYFIWLAFAAAHTPFHKPPNALHTRDALPVNGGKAYRRPYYEAMIEAMDTEIGRLLQDVDLTTTTVIFLGDNGTPGERDRDTLRGGPGQAVGLRGRRARSAPDRRCRGRESRPPGRWPRRQRRSVPDHPGARGPQPAPRGPHRRREPDAVPRRHRRRRPGARLRLHGNVPVALRRRLRSRGPLAALQAGRARARVGASSTISARTRSSGST